MTASELQRTAHVLVLQEMRDRFIEAGITSRTAALDAAISALAARPSPAGQGDVRSQFEAWHCEKFKTRWQTGAPTRDMHNGVYADNYGPAEQQERWELWQAALAARHPVGEVSVKKEDANNYCLILRALGMEEEGDPVSEVQALIEARDGQPVGAAVKDSLTVGGGQSWVVADGQGARWRMWGSFGPEWTYDRDQALHFARRADAEAFANDDEDAWLIQTVGAPAQAVDLVPVRAALDAAEALAVVCASVDGYSREEVAGSGRAMRQQFTDALALIGSQVVADQHPDDMAVDAFATSMKAKMAAARAKGRGGWEDPAQCSADDLSRMLRDHLEKGDPRDVANFCMMLHQRGEAIVPQEVQLPDNESVRQILGRPNFACIELAGMLRMRGDDIPHRAESEQAAVLRFLLNCYLELPDRWHDNARDKLRRIQRQAAEREPNSAPNRLTDMAQGCSQEAGK